MIVNIAYPSTHHRTAGVLVLYEFANGLARRDHEVHFIHGPAWPDRVNDVADLPDFDFDRRVSHHIVDSLEDPSLPDGDVIVGLNTPGRLGLPVAVVQGFKMISEEWEKQAFRARAPKICVAKWLVDVGLSYGVPREQLLYVPLGLDHETFAVRTSPGDRRYDVAVLYNGHPQKGWNVALRALHELRRRRPGITGVIFGIHPPPDTPPDGFELVRAPSRRSLADDVYNASKVFVQPSRHEGFGYTAVEAMACGAALVTTDNGGSRDYAIPDETAWVVEVNDAMGLAEGVLTLLEDTELRTRLATAGEKLVRRFDWELTAEALEGHLERYIADPDAFRRPPADTYVREGSE